MENNILGIETSGKICSVALYTNNSYKEININLGLTHSETLFFNIDKILNDNRIHVKDLSYIAISNGPGSYTGLRIGISCALGLSIVDNIGIRYVNTLKSLNYNVTEYIIKNNYDINNKEYIVSILDAKANRVYLGISDITNINSFILEKIVDINELLQILHNYNKKYYLIGDASVIYKDFLLNNYDNNYLHFVSDNYNNLNAKSIIEASQFKTNYIEYLNINYMQKSQAERNRINHV